MQKQKKNIKQKSSKQSHFYLIAMLFVTSIALVIETCMLASRTVDKSNTAKPVAIKHNIITDNHNRPSEIILNKTSIWRRMSNRWYHGLSQINCKRRFDEHNLKHDFLKQIKKQILEISKGATILFLLTFGEQLQSVRRIARIDELTKAIIGNLRKENDTLREDNRQLSEFFYDASVKQASMQSDISRLQRELCTESIAHADLRNEHCNLLDQQSYDPEGMIIRKIPEGSGGTKMPTNRGSNLSIIHEEH